MGRWYRFAPLGIVAGLLGILAFMAPGGQELEEKFGLHWLFHLRGTVKPPDDVIIIAIDHPSATQFGLPLLPRLWPRDMHARLIERLTAAGVQNVVFDLIFDAPSQVPEYDEELSRAMAASNNTILIERLTYQALNVQNESVYADIRYEGVTELLPVIADAARARAPFPLPKAERVNTYWTFKESAGDFPTAPVVVLQLFTLPLYDEFIRLLTTVDSALVAQLPANAASVVDIEDLVFAMRQLLTNHPNAAARIQAELYRTDWLDAVQKQHIAALLIAYSSDEKHYLNFYGPPRTVKTIPYHQALQSLTSGDQHRLLEYDTSGLVMITQ